MKKTYITILFLLLLTSGIYADSGSESMNYGLYINAGFGFANNLRMEDWLNNQRNFFGRSQAGANQTEPGEKSSVFYTGFNIEPRIFIGNIVIGPSFGYYSTTTGKRQVTGSNGTYRASLELNVYSLAATIYYKINLSDVSFLLLGGGLGYYNGALDIKYGMNNNIESHKANSWTIGWHTGLEYNRKLGALSLNFGVLSRFTEFFQLRVKNNANNA